MSEDYKIEKGIPVARPKKSADAFTLALRALDVGDSVKVDLKIKSRSCVSTTMTREGKAADKKFACRTVPATEIDPEHYRVWRVK
jgi:hypothetical protein